jgi:hypothetical protein
MLNIHAMKFPSSLFSFLLVLTIASGFQAPVPQAPPPTTSPLDLTEEAFNAPERVLEVDKSNILHPDRRDLLNIMASASLFVRTLSNSRPALAEETSAKDILLKLRSIPTFAIVNPDGVPFMIFDGQASATGYFFLSFDVAAQAIQDARTKDKNSGAAEVWSNAKIIVVPLAVALQLALRKTQRQAVNNELKFNTFNDIVPSSEGVEAAQEVEIGNKEKWQQKGRVPLFYIEGMTLADGKEPRYFNKLDLLMEWKRQHPNDFSPPVKLIELVDLYRTSFAKNDLDKVNKLTIMPVKETNQVASKLLKSSDGPLPAYSFDKVFLVSAAQG